MTHKKAQKIVQRLQEFKKKQQDQEFKSFAEVLEAIGKNNRGARILSEKRMLKAIDRWNSLRKKGEHCPPFQIQLSQELLAPN